MSQKIRANTKKMFMDLKYIEPPSKVTCNTFMKDYRFVMHPTLESERSENRCCFRGEHDTYMYIHTYIHK